MTPIERPQDQHHPVVITQRTRRGADAQLRAADAIAAFAGSLPAVNPSSGA